ncbi:hypothetical protein F5Y11DRAFT_365766 [Daldinia sp. FL1419]|nr:hypothetical protein F5Y11DRAFT_365766 [Daldinia sp. FL1419]
MCHIYMVYKFNCGHQEISPASANLFCLFNETTCRSSELGRYRICRVEVNQFCAQCQRVAISRAQNKEQWKPGTGDPKITLTEKKKQIAKLRELNTGSCMPTNPPGSNRVSQLNDMMKKNLEGILLMDNIFVGKVYADILRYISSLPHWLNRKMLANLMEPWLALVLDEEQQNSLRPTLRHMDCERMLDNIMAWTQD